MSRYVSQVRREGGDVGPRLSPRPAPSYTVAIPSSQEISRHVARIPANPPPSRSSPCPFHRPLRRLAAPAIRAAVGQICKKASPMPYRPDPPPPGARLVLERRQLAPLVVPVDGVSAVAAAATAVSTMESDQRN
jgi:hypothetical protein